jgi:hypothetical protein
VLAGFCDCDLDSVRFPIQSRIQRTTPSPLGLIAPVWSKLFSYSPQASPNVDELAAGLDASAQPIVKVEPSMVSDIKGAERKPLGQREIIYSV